MRNTFLNGREVLLMQSDYGDLGRVFDQSTEFGKVYESAEMLLTHIDKNTERLFRLDTEDMSAPEDVTEECAQAYLATYYGDRESDLPRFVRGSDAWARRPGAAKTDGGFTREEHGTHRTVGGHVAG